MRNSKIVLLLVIISISLLSWKKERLTKPTPIGANTFSCKIDGIVFLLEDVITDPVTPGLKHLPGDKVA